MRFYDALQWDTGSLKQAISTACDKKSKMWFLKALFVKDFLIVGFSILFIMFFTMFFDQANSSMAVVIFCILLSVRFVDFGYKSSHAMGNFIIVFVLLWIVPCLSFSSPLLAFITHFLTLGFIVVTTCEHQEMGNGGLYLFSYVFLCGNPVEGRLFYLRGAMSLVGLLLCAGVYMKKHRTKYQELSFLTILRRFDLTEGKSQWQLQMVLGLSLLFLLNEIVGIPYFMWCGFACASLLSTPSPTLKVKGLDRFIGVVLGCSLFAILYLCLPSSSISLLGIFAGLCLGLCASYRYKTVCNCFGALLLASGLYGLTHALILRIINNFMGIVFGLCFFWIYRHYIVKRLICNE